MKLRAPLLSFSAKGTLAKAATFISRHGTTHAQQIPDHSDANSPAQQLERQAFSDALRSWQNSITQTDTRSAWQRLNTYRIKKHTAYNAFLSQAIKALPSGASPSFAESGEILAGNKYRWEMVNLPNGDPGTEAGDFEVWIGSAPTKLSLYETATIDTNQITTSSLPIAAGEKYVTLRKDGTYRAGLSVYLGEPPPTPSAVPVGIVEAYAGLTIPTGWLLCDGAAISRATYADLFDSIGTIYGPGDGSTTFNIPALVGYFLRGGVPDGVQTPSSTAIPTAPFAADADDATHNHSLTGLNNVHHSHAASSGNASTGHTHDTTTGTQSASHTHTGTSGNNSAAHTHTGTTSDNSVGHSHSIANSVAHNHTFWVYGTTVTANHAHPVNAAAKTPSNYDAWFNTSVASDGVHNHGGNTGGVSANHNHTITTGTQSVNHTHDTTTGNQSAGHTHTGTSGDVSVTHNHAISTMTESVEHKHSVLDANATHGHAIIGGDAETAPDHVLMNYIIRAV